jgi:hypothetical protein
MADVPPCPPPEAPASNAPPEIFSVSKTVEDGLYDYTVLIDRQFNGFVLDGVVLAYVSDDDILLLSSVDVLNLDAQAAINFTVAPAISSDVRLLWTYREPKGMCPESVSFQYQFDTN